MDRHRRRTYRPSGRSIYRNWLNDEKGIAEAKVTSVRPLTEEETKALSSTFAAKVR